MHARQIGAPDVHYARNGSVGLAYQVFGDVDIEVRAGVHTGEVGTAGGKASGIAVTVAARIVALAEPSQVLVSQTVKDLVAGSGLRFHDRGSHELKGVEGEWHLYAVDAPEPK